MSQTDQPEEYSPLQASLLRVDQERKRLFEIFYRQLFEQHPSVEALFGSFSTTERKQMIDRILTSILASAEGEDWLSKDLAALGARHRVAQNTQPHGLQRLLVLQGCHCHA